MLIVKTVSNPHMMTGKNTIPSFAFMLNKKLATKLSNESETVRHKTPRREAVTLPFFEIFKF